MLMAMTSRLPKLCARPVFAAFALMTARAIQNFIKDMISEKTVRQKVAESDLQGV